MPPKQKMMVFARSKARLRNLPDFLFGGGVLELVEEYTYLGVQFSWNGHFNKERQTLKVKACRAMFAILAKGRDLQPPIDIMLTIFDACVLPILVHGCEVWGHENVDILEKVHTEYLKDLITSTNQLICLLVDCIAH
jgi:hypothetical protein